MVEKNISDFATIPMESPHVSPNEELSLLKQTTGDGKLLNQRYLIEKELGRGGVGVVYLGRDQQLLSRPVVIKFLLDESAEKTWFKKKFRQEIEALARIDHPGVIGVLDAGETSDGKLYLVMQFVEGSNLRSVIGHHGMDLERVAQIMRQMGQAISSAHDKGVFHRDLKPENIMLQSLSESEEYVKVIDFGIATVKDSQIATNRQSTEVAGTIAYMAPEQLMGKPVASSDIYAMGIIAYEIVTGRRPFNPNSPFELLDMQRAGVKVRPKDLRPELPEVAQDVILKALCFEPKDRYLQARDFGDALQQALQKDIGHIGIAAGQIRGKANSQSNWPTGTVTFLFTDIEGSTRLWEQHPDAMSTALARHDRLLRELIESKGGHVFKTVGDSFCVAFATAHEAVEAAVSAQHRLRAESWGETGPVLVRMALHTGTAELRDGDYFGPALNRVARILSAGYGGQILVSQSTGALVRNILPQGFSLRDLGEHRLKDLQQSERLFQVVTAELSVDFPVLRGLTSRPNNLTIQPTPLIGREADVAAVERLFRRGPSETESGRIVRLLTLTGPGGTGKTRLAVEVATNLSDDFDDGVFVVSLAAVRDAMLVASCIARALGLKEVGGVTLLGSVAEYLKDRQVLLLLDNFEHVISAAPLVAQLLADCPRLKMIVTSRAPLHLRGEYEFPLAPLALPDPKQTPKVDLLAQCPAVALFMQRALAVKPDFVLTQENCHLVAEICTRLDGLPLAIELAAARTKLLPPQAMLVRLENRLKILTDGARDLPARQQTMRSAIAWSYDLLDEHDKMLFRRLSVFSGGCTLDAIEAVCNSGDLKSDPLEGMSSLVDKNLVHQEARADGEPWFAMLETIREYASECLAASGEAGIFLKKHAFFFLELAEAVEPEMAGSGQAALLEQIESEHDNLRAALQWSKQNKEVEKGLRLGGALWRFWKGRGHLSEGRRWLEGLLAQAEFSEASVPTRAKAFRAQGILARMQGDYVMARSLLERSLSLYRELGDKRGIALSLDSLGTVLLGQDDYERAAGLLSESLELRREVGDRLGMANSLSNLAIVIVTYQQGDYVRAKQLCEESLALYRELDCEWGIATSLNNLGAVANQQGEHDRARALFVQSLALFQRLNDKAHTAICLEGLAGVACAQKEFARAARLLGAAETFCEASDTPLPLYMRTEHECSVAALRAGLSEPVFNDAWSAGQAMTMEQAVTYASNSCVDARGS